MISEAIPGKEEYQNSEKYQRQVWNWNHQNKITHLITIINNIRKEQLSLQQTNNIQFLETQSDQVMAYYKWSDSKENETLMICSLDAYYAKQTMVKMPFTYSVKVTDLITGNSYIWDKEWNFVELHPTLPFHLFKIDK